MKKRTTFSTRELELMYDAVFELSIIEGCKDDDNGRDQEKIDTLDKICSKLYRKINKL